MILDPTGNLLENIELLLAHADPEGEAFARLSRYRDHVRANVMLGPGPRAYIARLFSMLENVECDNLDQRDRCGVLGGECEYADRFRTCPYYKPPRGAGG